MTIAAGRGAEAGMRTILILLALSAFINYIDRGNLSVAAPLIKSELGISATQLGVLLSSFFWTYSCFQIVFGWILDRFDEARVLAAGFFLWSVATAGAGVVHGFAALLVMRAVLGVGEAAAYPCFSKILAARLPDERRGFANALIAAAVAGGPAFGVFAGGMLMSRVGWRTFFIVFGVASLGWLVPWFRAMPRSSASAKPKTDAAAPPLLHLLRRRAVWGTCAGLFCVNYVSYFLLTWLPFYLVRERHFSMDRMARISGASYLVSAMASAGAGWFSDRLIRKANGPTWIRKGFVALGLTFAGVFLVSCVASLTRIAIVLLWAGCAAYGVCASNVWAITQTLAGPAAAGKWTGLQNFVGNLAGVAAPALTGLVVDRSGRFMAAFMITSVVAVLGACVWTFVVGPVRRVEWAPVQAGSE
jgi:ACS family D-galactonate transporter-like MFS transporter